MSRRRKSEGSKDGTEAKRSRAGADGSEGSGGAGGASGIAVGDRVIINGRSSAVVRFIGTTEFAPRGIWVGVTLDKATGRNDGSIRGVRYFSTPPNTGLFVRPEAVAPYSEENHAAGTIGAAGRGLLGRKEAKRVAVAEIYNALDNDDEHAVVRTSSGSNSRSGLRNTGVSDRMARTKRGGRVKRRESAPGVESSYKGPHLHFPLAFEEVVALQEAWFSTSHPKPLHYTYTMQLLSEFTELSGRLPNVAEIVVPPGGHINVVGDTHGQLDDVRKIFELNGSPSAENPYLFNGDMVDRGEHGVEICLLLFAYKVADPRCMFINRGNHEDSGMNESYGFTDEVMDKYQPKRSSGRRHAVVRGRGRQDSRGRQAYMAFLDAFHALPLASLIVRGRSRVMVMHGGLSRMASATTLSHYARINRRRPTPFNARNLPDQLFEDTLWSDPRPVARVEESPRGAGVCFGSQLSHDFCKLNRLDYIIRSHEMMMRGYLVHHNFKVVTLFSASDYCGNANNLGAVARLRYDTKEPEFTTFFVPGEVRDRETRKELALERRVLGMLVERVCLKKQELFWAWVGLDEYHTGYVTHEQWRSVMHAIVGIKLPFFRIARMMLEDSDYGPDDRINFSSFLGRYHVVNKFADPDWEQRLLGRVCRALYGVAHDIKGVWRYFDASRSGVIEAEEFASGLRRLDIGLTERQIYDLLAAMDSNRDATIDWLEFERRFQVVWSGIEDERIRRADAAAHRGSVLADRRTASPAAPAEDLPRVDDFVIRELGNIGHLIFCDYETPRAAFQNADKAGSGYVNASEFAAALAEMGMEYEPDQLAKLFAAVDKDGTGRINAAEWLSAFTVVDTMESIERATSPDYKGTGEDSGGAGAATSAGPAPSLQTWQRTVLDEVMGALFASRVELGTVLAQLDEDDTGVISVERFIEGLECLIEAGEIDLTRMQVEEIAQSLDTKHDGTVAYDEWLGSFALRDARTGNDLEPNTTTTPGL